MKFLILVCLLVLSMLNLQTAESRDIAEDAREFADFEEDGFDDSEMELENAEEIPKKSPFWSGRRRRWVRHARKAVTAWKACTAAGLCG